MVKKISVNPFDAKSVADAIAELKAYRVWVLRKENELRLRLASIGATVASIHFARAIYNGTNDVSVSVDDNGTTATISADGKSVCFIEFGSGSKYGSGHPDAARFGMGPGTWSTGPNGKGHWDNPNGWFYAHGQHSYGNPPAMAMVQARDAMVEQLTAIAREVFK